MSADPVAGGNENAYNYPNDPVNRFDTTGMFDWGLALDIGLTVLSFLPIPGVQQVAMIAKVVIAVVKVASAVSKIAKAAKAVKTIGTVARQAAQFAGRQAGKIQRLVKGACSFSGDTGVLMADGSTKPIDEIQLGDKVWATDPETGEEGARVVTHLWVHLDTLTTFSTEAGDVVTTEDHPFWNASDGAWQGPQEFDAGDTVLTADGELVTVGALDPDSAYAGLAYNLAVDDIHTYYVDLGDTTALVHNKGDSCRRPLQSVQSQAISKATDAAGVVRCRYCKVPVTSVPGRTNSLHFDHVLAFVRGGSRSIANIVVACRSCNLSKGPKPLLTWLRGRR